MKKYLALLFLLPIVCFGQGAHRLSQVIIKGNGISANVSPGSKILVCVLNTGCATAANIYLDAGLTTPAFNPITADGSGNYDYYISSGCVDEQISSPGQGSIFVPNVCPFNGINNPGGGVDPSAVPFPLATYKTAGSVVSPVVATQDLSGHIIATSPTPFVSGTPSTQVIPRSFVDNKAPYSVLADFGGYGNGTSNISVIASDGQISITPTSWNTTRSISDAQSLVATYTGVTATAGSLTLSCASCGWTSSNITGGPALANTGTSGSEQYLGGIHFVDSTHVKVEIAPIISTTATVQVGYSYNVTSASSTFTSANVGDSVQWTAFTGGSIDTTVGSIINSTTVMMNSYLYNVFNGGSMTFFHANQVHAASAPFLLSQVGFTLQIPGAGAGGTALTGIITRYISPTDVIISTYPTATVSGQTLTAIQDDTASIQTAINNTCSLTGHGFYIPRGIYKISAALTFPTVCVGTGIHGDSNGGTEIIQTTDNTPIFYMTGSNNLSHALEIDHLWLSWQNQQPNTNTQADGIKFDSTDGTIHEVYIHDIFCDLGFRCITGSHGMWGLDIANIVGAGSMTGGTVILGAGTGLPRVTLRNIYSTQTVNEPQIAIANAGMLNILGVEGNNGLNTIMDLSGSSGRVSGVDNEVGWNTGQFPIFVGNNSNITWDTVTAAENVCPSSNTPNMPQIVSDMVAGTSSGPYGNNNGQGSCHATVNQPLYLIANDNAGVGFSAHNIKVNNYALAGTTQVVSAYGCRVEYNGLTGPPECYGGYGTDSPGSVNFGWFVDWGQGSTSHYASRNGGTFGAGLTTGYGSVTTAVTITAGGTGYLSTDAVVFSGGSCTTYPTGAITAIGSGSINQITATGAVCTVRPNISITSGTGSGFVGSFADTLFAAVGGTAYTTGDTLTFSGGGCTTNPVGSITAVDGNGAITSGWVSGGQCLSNPNLTVTSGTGSGFSGRISGIALQRSATATIGVGSNPIEFPGSVWSDQGGFTGPHSYKFGLQTTPTAGLDPLLELQQTLTENPGNAVTLFSMHDNNVEMDTDYLNAGGTRFGQNSTNIALPCMKMFPGTGTPNQFAALALCGNQQVGFGIYPSTVTNPSKATVNFSGTPIINFNGFGSGYFNGSVVVGAALNSSSAAAHGNILTSLNTLNTPITDNLPAAAGTIPSYVTTGTSGHVVLWGTNGQLTDGGAPATGFTGTCAPTTTLTVINGLITGCS